MTGSILLNGEWELAWAEGYQLHHPSFAMAKEKGSKAFLKAQVPAPIHRVLIDHGLIDDPNIGLNSLKCRWVEEMFWVYRLEFEAPAEALDQCVRLTFQKLELDAEIELNCVPVGTHANAHREARFDLTGKLRPGKNLLVVKLSSGMHSAADKPATGYHAGDTAFLTKRHWHRHPQCQSGWDWRPRLVNVGILGDVELAWSCAPFLEEPSVVTLLDADLRHAEMQVGATLVSFAETPVDGRLTATLLETGDTVTQTVTAAKGEIRQLLGLSIENPRLWWPAGHGEQFLYHVELKWEAVGEVSQTTMTTGIRRVEIDQSEHPDSGRYCILKVNNRPIFARGGNWVPPDMLYSEVTPERYQHLVRLALEANFNMLRIWGGASFADRALLEACDNSGIMIWHDFLFACAQYPLHDQVLLREVHQEIRHAVRIMSVHPSLLVWCGNNEIDENDWDFYMKADPSRQHYVLFHLDIPRIMKAEDQSKIYWPASPWSPDILPPNDPTAGDQHPWQVSLKLPGGADWWLYRERVDRFPNEGGVLGMCPASSVRRFLAGNERRLFSPAWEHHDNPFAVADCEPGSTGHAYQTVQLWTGFKPEEMDYEKYAFVSGLLHGDGLSEYITNYRRRMFNSAAAVFWMYNDCWPTLHSWTILDYYCKRKLAYHPVRRAFNPVTVVVSSDAETVTVHGVNDTPEIRTCEVRFGIFALAGGMKLDRTLPAELPANASTVLAEFPLSVWQEAGLKTHGCFAMLIDETGCSAWHRLFLERFKDLEFASPAVRISRDGEYAVLESDVFVWGVCLDPEGELPLADDCFDLLPGVPYRVKWNFAEYGEPCVLKCGSRDAVKQNP